MATDQSSVLFAAATQLRRDLNKLGYEGAEIAVERRQRSGSSSTFIDVNFVVDADALFTPKAKDADAAH